MGCLLWAGDPLIKIGSGCGLLPNNTKPLLEPMLTYRESSMRSRNFMGNTFDIIPKIFLKATNVKLLPHLLVANELKDSAGFVPDCALLWPFWVKIIETHVYHKCATPVVIITINSDDSLRLLCRKQWQLVISRKTRISQVLFIMKTRISQVLFIVQENACEVTPTWADLVARTYPIRL